MSRVGLVKLTPMMGNAVNVSRQTVALAVAGSVARICESRLFT